jgi:hypothetical protein
MSDNQDTIKDSDTVAYNKLGPAVPLVPHETQDHGKHESFSIVPPQLVKIPKKIIIPSNMKLVTVKPQTETQKVAAKLKQNLILLYKEIYDKFTAPDDDGNPISEADLDISKDNVEFINELVKTYLFPPIIEMVENTTQLKKETFELKTRRKTQESLMNSKKRTCWGIYLSDIAKTLPGYKEATAKLTFAAAEYNKLSAEEKDQIVVNYYKALGIDIPKKAQRISGLDAFRKYWYEERKKTEPDARGLDSRCTQDWKTLTDDERAKWKEIRKQQLSG